MIGAGTSIGDWFAANRGRYDPDQALTSFEGWFQAYRAINAAREWIDVVPWLDLYFLSSGKINFYGVWDDTEVLL